MVLVQFGHAVEDDAFHLIACSQVSGMDLAEKK
jgi:hypothetical protein